MCVLACLLAGGAEAARPIASESLKVAALASVLSAASAQWITCSDPNSADGISRAIDAAIMKLQGQKGWFHGLRTSSGYTNAMSVFSCTPDVSKWVFPAEAEATGILARVLRTNTLRVAGVKWSASSGAANYNAEPPVGFWPGYMEAITAQLSANYGRTIALERVYFANSGLVVDAVAAGIHVDMSEPYYYLSGFNANVPRIESMAFSCVTAGLASKFFTTAGSGVTSTDELYTKISDGPNRAVGFIGQGNYDAVSNMLPDSVTPTFVTNATDMAANVLSGALVAGYVSEGLPPNPTAFEVFETGIISPRVALFRKDDPGCSTAGGVLAAVREGAPGLIAAVVVVAVVALLSIVLLAYLICKERSGSPVFMPLLNTAAVEAVKPQL